jgi:hypothetical protein
MKGGVFQTSPLFPPVDRFFFFMVYAPYGLLRSDGKCRVKHLKIYPSEALFRPPENKYQPILMEVTCFFSS